ncbi:unnamed protein product [Caenorhabditis angaria]|uniref:Uncharacterized protein n=1 Tax=Caenorhabditis angaria TaxID=860376 RepID=A0A9P1I6F9_9PELO|nr:unnamed protein product [Caenorhabditis angaria]
MIYLSSLTRKDCVDIEHHGNPETCFLNQHAFMIPYNSLDSYSLALCIDKNERQRSSAISKVSISEKQRNVNVFYEKLTEEQLGYSVDEHIEEIRRNFFGDQIGVTFQGFTYDSIVDPTPNSTICVYESVHKMLNRFYEEIRRSELVNNMVERFLSTVPNLCFDADLEGFKQDKESIMSYIRCFQKIRLIINDQMEKFSDGFDMNLAETCSNLCNIFLPFFERIVLESHLLSRKSSTMSDIFVVIKNLERDLPASDNGFDFEEIFHRCFQDVYEKMDYKFAIFLDPRYAYKKQYMSNVEWAEVANKLVEMRVPHKKEIFRKEIVEYKQLVALHPNISNLEETIDFWHEFGRRLQNIRHIAQCFSSIFPQYVHEIPARNIVKCRGEAETVLQTDYFQGAGFEKHVYISKETYSAFAKGFFSDIETAREIEKCIFNIMYASYCDRLPPHLKQSHAYNMCYPATNQPFSIWRNQSNSNVLQTVVPTPQKSNVASQSKNKGQTVAVKEIEMIKIETSSEDENSDDEKAKEEEYQRRSKEIRETGMKKNRFHNAANLTQEPGVVGKNCPPGYWVRFDNAAQINDPRKINRVASDQKENNEEETEEVQRTKEIKKFTKRKACDLTNVRRSTRPKKPKRFE